MPALEIGQDEIGRFDPLAYKARSARLWGVKTKPLGAHLYDAPIGPVRVVARVHRDWLDVKGPGATIHVPEIKLVARRVRISEIIKIVSTVHGISTTDIVSKRRCAAAVRPRHEAMWLAKKFTTRSLPEIGREFGDRDHTTVLHAVRKVEAKVSAGEYEALALPFVADLDARLKAAAVEAAE
jgi:hypothetical protein